MEHYINTKILSRAQYMPIYIPVSSSIRVFKKIYGDSWYELDRVDLMEGSSPDTYSYDEKLYALLFNPMLVGNTLQIQYDHNKVPNPGTIDLLPSLIIEQASFNYNRIVSGLYVVDSYMMTNVRCGSSSSLTLDGGIIAVGGEMYSVGNTYWDLNQFGAAAGDNIVSGALFYISHVDISESQRGKRFISVPSYMKTTKYNFSDGGGISSALTELNERLQQFFSKIGTTDGFIEIMRLIIISKKSPEQPETLIYYEPKYRVMPEI
jgi:hypothetical protein